MPAPTDAPRFDSAGWCDQMDKAPRDGTPINVAMKHRVWGWIIGVAYGFAGTPAFDLCGYTHWQPLPDPPEGR